jgi:hypothetical protein
MEVREPILTYGNKITIEEYLEMENFSYSFICYL